MFPAFLPQDVERILRRLKEVLTGREAARQVAIQLVVDLPRAVDLLGSRPEVDARRIAFVGRGLRARFGAVLAGVETRLAGYVLVVTQPSVTECFPHGETLPALQLKTLQTPERQARYLEAILLLDAVQYVHRAASAAILFRFAKHDDDISEAAGIGCRSFWASIEGARSPPRSTVSLNTSLVDRLAGHLFGGRGGS